MTKKKAIATRTAAELAKTFGLERSSAYEWEVQAVLLSKLTDAIKREKLTHAQVAERAGTSRTRVTSILNGNLEHVSTDLLIRLLGSLGYGVSVSVSKSNIAA